MKIIKYKKLSNGKYKVSLDNGENLTLHENIIIKYNLLLKKEINDEYNDVINDNNNYLVYDMSLKYISIKMRCESEIRKYLLSKNIDNILVDSVLNKLRKEKYINDELYVRSYISDKVRLNGYGFNKIKRDLLNLNIDCRVIENEINKFPKDIILENLSREIDKKIKSNRKYGGNVLKQKIVIYFINKGYNREDINNILNDKDISNDKLYEKEYNRLYNKYSKKYSADELDYIIKQNLYKKGIKK